MILDYEIAEPEHYDNLKTTYIFKKMKRTHNKNGTVRNVFLNF